MNQIEIDIIITPILLWIEICIKKANKNYYVRLLINLSLKKIIFNWKYIYAELLDELAPIIHDDYHFIFENITELKLEYINTFRSAFCDYSINLYSQKDKIKYIILYTKEKGSEWVSELTNIRVFLKLFKLFSEIFIKERLVWVIKEAALYDVQVLLLLEKYHFYLLEFDECIIRTTKFDISCESFKQKSIFTNWRFNGITPNYEFNKLIMKIQNRNQGMTSLSKLASCNNKEFNFPGDYLCFIKRKRSLILRVW